MTSISKIAITCMVIMAMLLFSMMPLEVYATPNDNFLQAVEEGDVEAVRNAIENGADVNAKSPEDKFGMTALMVAALKGHISVTEVLLEHGVDVNATVIEGDGKGITALMAGVVSKLRNPVIITRLLEHGADVNAKTFEGLTALMFAIQGGAHNIAKLLLDHGADVNIKATEGNGKGMTPLMLAISLRAVSLVGLLLQYDAEVNTQITHEGMFKGWTSLVFALNREVLDAIERLLKHGADPNVEFIGTDFEIMGTTCGNIPRTTFFGEEEDYVECQSTTTPLMVAAEKWDGPYFTEFLLDHGAAVDAKITEGKWKGATALMAAAKKGHTETVELLITRGADINAQITAEGKYQGWTALLFALDEEHIDIAKLLIEEGADPNSTIKADGEYEGWPILFFALYEEYLDIARLLIERGADVNAIIPEAELKGVTALILAAGGGNPGIVKLLLKRGTDVNAKITSGELKGVTALMAAAGGGSADMVKLLLEYGADVNTKVTAAESQYKEWTALMFAELDDHPEIVQILKEVGATKVDVTPNYDLIQAVENADLKAAQNALIHGANVNVKVIGGATVLMVVIRDVDERSTDLVTLLLDYDADVNAQIMVEGEYHGWTALMFAVKKKNTDMIKLLLEHGADTTAKVIAGGEYHGWTALVFAIDAERFDITKLLLEHGANPNTRVTINDDIEGATALMFAIDERATDIVKLLLDHGADVNTTLTGGKRKGATALLIAAEKDHAEIVKLLIKHNADVNAKVTAESEYKGWTTLSFAVEKDNTDLVRLLIELSPGVDIRFVEKDLGEITPLIFAAAKGDTDLVEYLLAHDADVNAAITEGKFRGKTAFKMAKAEDHWNILDLLIDAGAIVDKEELISVEKSKAARTKADMKAISVALEDYRFFDSETNTYPKSPLETNISAIGLPKKYYDGPYNDAWGTSFRYISDGDGYTLKSYGADKTEEGSEFDADIVYSNGEFIVP